MRDFGIFKEMMECEFPVFAIRQCVIRWILLLALGSIRQYHFIRVFYPPASQGAGGKTSAEGG